MAKTKISEFDTNPDLNTDINSINIAEGCAPSGINNAIRTLMSDLKEWQSGAQDIYIAPAGTAAAPAWTFNGDTDTGFYRVTANELGVAAGGSAVGRFTSAGFVGNVTGNATNVTGTVAVANGGTGATTLASGQFLKGAGTSAVTTSATVALGSEVSGTLPVANGGTGASDAGTARTNLGLGSIATQAANNVAITGGSISGITDIAVADGGTGASDAATARTNLGVPSNTGTGASGTWGISITGNAATATSATTAANGGVTSVNGQTGAITQTSVDSIGSYIVALYVPGAHPGTNSLPLSIGATVNGSTLRYGFTQSVAISDFEANAASVGSTTYNSGGTALSGTWRCMGRPAYDVIFDESNTYIWRTGLFVRVS